MAKQPSKEEFPSNNLEEPNEPKKLKHPIKLEGGVEQKRKSTFARDVQDISVYLYEDVILPAVKTALSDFVTNGIQALLWGINDGPAPRRRTSGRRFTNYNSRSTMRRSNYQRRVTVRDRRDQLELDDIVFSNRDDGNRVRAQMMEYVAEFGMCSVGDLYNLLGWSSSNIHERMGWYDLSGMRLLNTRDGFALDLPDPEELR